MEYNNKGNITVQGIVISGRGLSSSRPKNLHNNIENITKKRLIPGSLNIILLYPILLNKQTLSFNYDGRKKLIYPATIKNTEAFIYRWEKCPLHIIELMSSINLRNHLKLSDGSLVFVEINNNVVHKLSKTKMVGWNLIWKYYESSYYSDSYHCKIRRYLSNLFGINQY